MNAREAEDLAKTAHELMPKSSEAQRDLLADAIERFSINDALKAIGDHAQVSEYISVPEILKRIRVAGIANAADRLKAERAAAIQRQNAEKAERNATHSSVNAAFKFCEEHEEKMDEWRRDIESGKDWPLKLTHGKPTLDCTALVCAIYTKFGKIPVECGL